MFHTYTKYDVARAAYQPMRDHVLKRLSSEKRMLAVCGCAIDVRFYILPSFSDANSGTPKQTGLQSRLLMLWQHALDNTTAMLRNYVSAICSQTRKGEVRVTIRPNVYDD